MDLTERQTDESFRRPLNRAKDDDLSSGSLPNVSRADDHDALNRPSNSKADLVPFSCHVCSTTFTTAWNLKQHMKTLHGDQSYVCNVCSKSFRQKSTLTRHGKTHGSQKSLQFPESLLAKSTTKTLRIEPDATMKNSSTDRIFSCDVCAMKLSKKSNLIRHRRTHTPQNCVKCGETFPSRVSLSLHLKLHKSTLIPLTEIGDPASSVDPRNQTSATCPPSGCTTALRGSYERHRVEGSDKDVDLLAFLRSQHHAELIKDGVQRKKSIKCFVSVNILMVRPKNWITRGDQESRPYFTSRCYRVLAATNIHELLETAYEKIVNSMTQYLREGSGWIIGHVNFVDLVISTYKPIQGSTHIPLPSAIAHTEDVIVNVKNNDQKCFLWAVLSALHPAQRNPQRLQHYLPYENSMNFGNLTFPILPDDIPKFEELNNIRINLFGFLESEVIPIYISDVNSKINLLLISDGIIQHFCWITNFNKFMDIINDS